MIFLRDDIVAIQRGVFNKLLKKIGHNLLTGQSVMNVSFPVCVFTNMTMLHRNALELRFIPILLDEVQKTLDEPVDMMGRVVGLVAGFQCYNLEQTKPFNPIWGETLNVDIEGLDFSLEQVMHHPPISMF